MRKMPQCALGKICLSALLVLASCGNVADSGGASHSPASSEGGSRSGGGGSSGNGGVRGDGGSASNQGGSNNAGGAGGSNSTGNGGTNSPIEGTGGMATGSGGANAGSGGSAPQSSGGTTGGNDAGTPASGGASGTTPPPAGPPAALSSFAHHRDVKLNTTPTGAGIATALTNYPVPIQLSKDNFNFAEAKPDGADIRFAKAEGTILPHEIELWDAANQQAAIWVKSNVAANSDAVAFVMYWGNPAAASTSDGKAVFPQAENWVAAWHLGDDAATTQDGFKDATGVNHGTGHNLEKGAARPGRMGLATNLDHLKKQGVKVVENRKNFDYAKDITFEIWGFVRSFGYNKGYESYMTKGDESWRYMRSGTTALTEICSDGNAPVCVFSKSSIGFGKWYHFAGVHEGGHIVRLYINGKREGQGTASGEHGSFGDHAVTLGFSLHKMVEQRFMDMIIDEARFLKVAKTDDWVKLDYESIREGSTFVSFGPVVNGK